MNSRIVVLASNSFAGSVFVSHALDAGHTVLGLSRSAEPDAVFLPYAGHPRAADFRFVRADIRTELDKVCAELSAFCPDYVVDFAGQGMVAESWAAPEQWYETNIVAKVKLHAFLRKQSWLKKYVRISTPEVYGSHEQLIGEDQPYRPSTPYAVSHSAIDMSVMAFHRNYGFPVVLGRFANFYGPHQQLYRIVPRTIIYARSGRKLQLHGGGTSVRAFIHAQDVARGIALMLEKGRPGEVYHFSPDSFVSIRQLVETLCVELGVAFSDFVEVAGDRPGKDQAYLMSAAKSRNELGWRDEVSLESGLGQSIAWVDRHWDKICALPLDYIHRP
ncbi:MAG: GDP-mannose 4,6-dehydratase [Candidatus Protistobacter heckmanni]|nr:GDP-mannose 4,6-dehydratase [Candidatus Protistobacter heckmanni]